MHLALAPQYHLVGFLIVIEPQRWILLHQLGDGAGELHLVLAVGNRDGKAIDRPASTERTSWRVLALRRRHRLAGRNILEPAQRHRIAGTGDRDLARCPDPSKWNTPATRASWPRAPCRIAPSDSSPASTPDQRQLAAMRRCGRSSAPARCFPCWPRDRGARQVASTPGASWRSAFSSRKMPLPFSPSRTAPA